MIKLSIIIPTLNEEVRIWSTIQELRKSCQGAQIIVVDGGSKDNTVKVAKKCATLVISARGGRATQMNAGARLATGDVLVFSPADTRYPPNFCAQVDSALKSHQVAGGGFLVKFAHPGLTFRIIEFSSNMRARFQRIFYLDQALFVRKTAFENVGGFPEVKIMEETMLCERLKQTDRLAVAPAYVILSPRRFVANGPIWTWLKMGLMRMLYTFGADQDRLWKVWSSLRRGQ